MSIFQSNILVKMLRHCFGKCTYRIFGIPIYIGDDNHDVLVNYILEQSSLRAFESTVDHYSIGMDDMREFLVTITQRTIDMSPEASNLLQRYFVASRANRPSKVLLRTLQANYSLQLDVFLWNIVDCLTKQAYVVLKQFAESFARLSLRHEVLRIDAMAAIVLCEHFIQHVYEMEEHSAPTFGAVNFIGIVDEYMQQFQQWLDDYILKYEG